MAIFNNRYIKLILTFAVILVIINCVLIYFTSKVTLNMYNKEINENIANIIGNVKNSYPDISEEEIIKILNNNENYNSGKKVLRDYGIDSEESAILTLNKKENKVVTLNIIVCSSVSFALVILFICYLKYRQKKIYNLVEYLQELSNKNYSLNIEENTEDELSKLKNEIYKISVLLKEEADNSNKKNEDLLVFLSDISHQLKTPLTSSIILLDNLNESTNMDETTKSKFITEISHQIELMNFLITSLLKLSKLDAGVVNFSNSNVDIKGMISDIVHELEIIAELKNVKIEMDGDSPIINIDYNWNKEAIKNIVKNAIEHTNENSVVNIKVHDNNIYTQVSIVDQGVGIDQKDIKHIFDRFYKSKNSPDTSIGIGLSLAKAIIEKQNGYITVNSTFEIGSEFIITYLK